MTENINLEAHKPNANYPPTDQCIPQETTIRNVRLAAAYVPFQKFCTRFFPIEALKLGTVFPELYSPYMKKEKKYKHILHE